MYARVLHKSHSWCLDEENITQLPLFHGNIFIFILWAGILYLSHGLVHSKIVHAQLVCIDVEKK